MKISLFYIEDLVDIISNLFLHPGPFVINVARDQAPSIREITRTLARLLGREAFIRRIIDPRQGILIADISLLQRCLSPRFTRLSDGLAHVVGSPCSAESIP